MNADDCIICGDPLSGKLAPNLDPWGYVQGWAHFKCMDNYEPGDRQGEAPETDRERYEAAWRQKESLR